MVAVTDLGMESVSMLAQTPLTFIISLHASAVCRDTRVFLRPAPLYSRVGTIQIDQHEANETHGIEVQPHSAISVERSLDKP